MAVAARSAPVSLGDRYEADRGEVVLSGIQALVRVLLDRRARDAAAGLDTGVFVSGYPGSPLGGLDQELARQADRLDRAGIVFRPGLNEELAATAVGGTQLLGELPGACWAGVAAFWYGKNPGLDRAADAVRHANLSGTAPLGGAVALVGDDPAAKSSTVPSGCEPLCRSLMVPVLAAGSVQELLAAGVHAVELSRHAGTWSAIRITAEVADSRATVTVGEPVAAVPALEPRANFTPPVLLPPTNAAAERDLVTVRLDRARAYATAAGLNVAVTDPVRPRLAIVAAGAAHQAVVRALDVLGLDAEQLDRLGVRLVRLGLVWPLDGDELRALLDGVETVLVVEDKLPFLETEIRAALYRMPRAPLVVGERDPEGRPLIPAAGAVCADDVERALGRVLDDADLPERARARFAALAASGGRPPGAAVAARTPYFCSGCPHNSSTRSAPHDPVGVGIGCHTMVALDHSHRRGRLIGMPQMGGEGAQWIGLAPFAAEPHFTQNIGDGTFHHSGSLAIRAAVAAGVDITFRLLYNDAVAMTGGQRPEGKLDVASLTRLLAAEGVRRVVVTAADPSRYRGVTLAPGATVRDRSELAAVQTELAAERGVTVLIHDDRCAAEKRRMRKRGELAEVAERVWINERVCEGCGDCGERSSCLSVQPVETEFGRKTRIHQGSCNSDMSCLAGDCPSFVIVTPARPADRARTPATEAGPPAPPLDPPAPEVTVGPNVLVRLPGVGGSGVVTVAAIVEMAAHLDGLHAAGLDQTGLAQKGGPVVSDVRLSTTPISGELRAGTGEADVVVGFDLLTAAAPATVASCAAGRTVAVVNSAPAPTARMVTDAAEPAADVRLARRRIDRHTAAERNLYIDAAELAGRLFGDQLQANVVLLGAAFQHGCLPLSAASIEQAIRLNGTAVETNLAAFAWGRAAVSDPAAAAPAPPPPVPAPLRPDAARLLGDEPDEPRLRALLERRAGELIGYQNERYARAYITEVRDVARLERAAGGDGTVACAYARGLFKLMAYKDEYEVARLHLDAAEVARREAEFGPGAKVEVLLHPPVLRALGLTRKLRLGRSAVPLLRVLRRARRLRGTPFDPFGRSHVRRVERALAGEYAALVRAAIGRLTPATAGQVAAIAALPDVIRGYERIKLDNVERFRAQAAALGAALFAEPVVC